MNPLVKLSLVILLVGIVGAIAVLLIWGDPIQECMASGHTFIYCHRLLRW